MSELDPLAAEWARALGEWAIPSEILDAAPESPWVHPPTLFHLEDDAGAMPDTASFREAGAALGRRGTVLDVGCGGGRSSLPLAALITHITGVDESEAMLAQFTHAAAARGTPCTTVRGRWPEVAAEAASADVVVCHHVAYNVADIVPFLAALTAHARRRVVLEVTARHPQSSLNALWKHFWDLERPQQPTADLLAEIVRAMGYHVTLERGLRPPRRQSMDRAEVVAFVRQRLCLTPERDAEVDVALGDEPALSQAEFVTIAWTPPTSA